MWHVIILLPFFLKVGDESISAISFQMTVKGNLPHLSYIYRKTDPLGKEFNTVACYVTGAFIFIEVHIWKEGINYSKYQN